MAKCDVVRYEEYQIYLLKNGMFVLITEIEPLTKFNNEDSRKCYCKVGRRYKKSDQFKYQFNMVIENPAMRQMITIDVSDDRTLPMAELRDVEAMYVGKLSKEKIAEYRRLATEYINTLDNM